jgi:hypothetical protein
MDRKRTKIRKTSTKKPDALPTSGSLRKGQDAGLEGLDQLARQPTRQAVPDQKMKASPASLAVSELLQLQHLMGNQTAGRLIEEMKGVAATQDAQISQLKRAGVIQADFESDKADLISRRDSVGPGLYRDLLSEAIQSAERVRVWHAVATGGHAERRFTAEGDVAGYILHYQANATDATQKIANFIHELTHISVEEAYGSDFVNYANPPSDRGIARPDFGELAVVPRFGQAVKGIKNEEQRQTDRMVAEANKILLENLNALDGLVGQSGLTAEQNTQISSKINYGQINVHKEYDTVLNQIYMWCKGWNANPDTRFFKMLEAMVQDAYNRRQNREAVSERVPLPADQKKCYITTACTLSRGLPDDCEELTVLRSFRDRYVLDQPNGKQLVAQYYRYAPAIVETIDQQKEAAAIYDQLYQVIRTCVQAIQNGDHPSAFNTYCEMVDQLKQKYAPDIVFS